MRTHGHAGVGTGRVGLLVGLEVGLPLEGLLQPHEEVLVLGGVGQGLGGLAVDLGQALLPRGHNPEGSDQTAGEAVGEKRGRKKKEKNKIKINHESLDIKLDQASNPRPLD